MSSWLLDSQRPAEVAKGLAFALAGLALLAAAGCSAPQPAPGAGASGGGATTGGEATPKVNRLVFVTEPPATERNETRNLSTPNAWQYTPMYETLLGVDENTGKRIPALATEWKVGADNSSYEFTLRKGVKFHTQTANVQGDWGEFTAKDLVQPYKEILKKDSISGVTEMWWNAVKDIQVVDDYHATIHLARADANFLDYVSDQLGGYEIWSTKAFEQLGPPTDLTKPALPGTGAYMYDSRAQGQYIRFKRTPYKQWKATPDFPEFEFRFVREASTRMAALLAGEAQMATLPQDLMTQAEKAGYKIFTGNVLRAQEPRRPEFRLARPVGGARQSKSAQGAQQGHQ
jgi:ABC-type transport system substrate-binding protein